VDDLSGAEESSEEEAPKAVPTPAAKKQTAAPVKLQEPAKPATSGKGDADSSSDEEDEVVEQKKAKAVKNQKLKKDLKKEQEELGKILMTKRQR
jgi:hypothetical protein